MAKYDELCGNPNAPPAPVFQLTVRRNHLVEDTFRQLDAADHCAFKRELLVNSPASVLWIHNFDSKESGRCLKTEIKTLTAVIISSPQSRTSVHPLFWMTEPWADAPFIPSHDTIPCYQWTCLTVMFKSHVFGEFQNFPSLCLIYCLCTVFSSVYAQNFTHIS